MRVVAPHPLAGGSGQVARPGLARVGRIARPQREADERVGLGERADIDERLARGRVLHRFARVLFAAVGHARLFALTGPIEREREPHRGERLQRVLGVAAGLTKERDRLIEPAGTALLGEEGGLDLGPPAVARREPRGVRQERPERRFRVREASGAPERAAPREERGGIVERVGVARVRGFDHRDGLAKLAEGDERPSTQHRRRGAIGERAGGLVRARDRLPGLVRARRDGELRGAAREKVAVATEHGVLRALPDVRSGRRRERRALRRARSLGGRTGGLRKDERCGREHDEHGENLTRGALPNPRRSNLRGRHVRLADTIGRWLGRVEVVLGGAEIPLREGEEALAAGEPARARAAAHEILARVPGSPLGLALLADACEMAGLEAEYAMALEELAQRVPSRADVWVRLGRARATTGAPSPEVREAYVRALGVADPGGEARREALLALADLDLAQGEAERAELWLERIAGDRAPDVALRRAEVRLARADATGALAELARIEIAPTNARANLALGRARSLLGDPEAFTPLVRAAILEAPGASEALSSALGWIPSDDAVRASVRRVVDARGESRLARFRAAFARAEGRRDEARAALIDAVRSGEAGAARPLLDAALEDRDPAALTVAVDAIDPRLIWREPNADAASVDATLRDAKRLVTLVSAGGSLVSSGGSLSPGALGDGSAGEDRGDAVLEEVALLSTPRAIAWGSAIRAELARAWVPAKMAARWDLLLARLERVARALHDLEASARIAGLSAERRRPLRLAIVGEFNAGKSTFINALVGQEIAPMGVLPTTATLHHLRYAPDPIARILFRPGAEPPERIASVADLRAALKSIDAAEIRRVEILLPIASLTRVEILDTPGFNAPDVRHTDAARRAFEEADAAIWLLDAGQPMKQSERAVLDEARAARLPVQVLVNKADRLAAGGAANEENRARVLESVRQGLAEMGLESWSPPLLVSARRALAGKLGDAAALAESGWDEVEAMLEREFVARSEELKERALRRRALAIVAALGQAAARVADQELASAEATRRRVESLGHAAARIDREAETVASRIVEGIGSAAAAWRSELANVAAGRSADGLAGDLSLQRYRVERALANLSRPLAHALAGAADGTGIAPPDLAPIARASIRGFASVAGDTLVAAPQGLLPLARSAVASLVEHLAAAAASPSSPPRAAGLVGELTSFADVLA